MFESLKCHFLHSKHYVYLLNLSSQCLYFMQKFRKCYVIWWPTVLVLEYFFTYFFHLTIINHLGWGGFSVNRKKPMFFENRNTRNSMLLLEKNWKKPGKNGGGDEENRYFTKIEPYLYEFVANESSFGIIYSWKTKEILFEIWYRHLQNISLI